MSLRVLLYSRVNPADGGGVQTVVARLAAHLRARGHRAATAWRLPNPDPEARDETWDLPLLVWRRGLPAPRASLRAARALLRLAARLWRLRPAIVNVHFVTAEAAYFLLLRPLFRYRLVLSVHGSDVMQPKPWDAPVLPRLLRAADAITVVSSPAAARVRASPGVNPGVVKVIPNGVRCDFWSAAAPARDVAARAPVILSVGRLHPVKGHDVLLRGFARVRDRLPDAALAIVGDGVARPAVARLAAELGVAHAVEFAGTLSPAQVRDRLGAARVFVQPSRSEGLPLALLEAMAAGVPVVATRVGGVPDVVAPGTGLLVPPEQPDALADALLDVLGNDGLASALARGGRQRAMQFSAARADGAYEALFLELDGRALPALADAAAGGIG